MTPEPTQLPADSEGLPVRRTTGRATWRLASAAWQASAERAGEWIADPQLIPAMSLLKRGERRLVFRLEARSPDCPEVVVKAFPLATVRQRWKQDKYAPAEARNLREAARRGLPVPAVFGLGWRRRFGLVSWNALLLEFVAGRPLRERLAQATADAAVQRGLLWRVLPLFQKVYETGCNHIDLGPHAILMGETGAGSGAPDRLIDFQYCRFQNRPSGETFARQAGYFGWCLTAHWNLVPKELVLEWFESLLCAVGLEARAAVLRELFLHRLSHRASIRERLAG